MKGHEMLFKQGEAADSCYIILRGAVNVRRFEHKENETDNKDFDKIVAVLYDGQGFGELALIPKKNPDKNYHHEKKVVYTVESWKDVKKKINQLNRKEKRDKELREKGYL